MAEFITKCPHCQNNLQVEDEWLGMDVDCPLCSKTFTVHMPSAKRSKNNNRTSSTPKYYCSNCKKEHAEPVKFCSECGSEIQNKSSKSAKKAAQADKPDDSSTFYTWFWAIAILIGVPVLLTIWIDWPRTIFWCTLPLWGICLGVIASEVDNKLAILLFAGIICWGWWAHTRVEIPTPEETAKTETPAQMEKITGQAPAATSAQANNTRSSSQEDKIQISVTVRHWMDSDRTWKYNCEYKLYADDQLIATKNSTAMIVKFNVKVEKGATLRAEMLGKNGFGGIAETLVGPLYGQTATANYDGESITIKCI